ncbi:MAG: pyridoxamine 5'-phosphate oxidase family protein [Oscillospiraceae bacterium]
MDLLQLFNQEMASLKFMSLATSVNNMPNVRVVNFGYNPATPRLVYFSTFKGNQKIEEMAENANVALMPLPLLDTADIQVRITGKARPSTLTLQQLTPMMTAKDPGFAETSHNVGPMLTVYEVEITHATLTLGMNDAVEVPLG